MRKRSVHVAEQKAFFDLKRGKQCRPYQMPYSASDFGLQFARTCLSEKLRVNIVLINLSTENSEISERSLIVSRQKYHDFTGETTKNIHLNHEI